MSSCEIDKSPDKNLDIIQKTVKALGDQLTVAECTALAIVLQKEPAQCIRLCRLLERVKK